MNDPAHSSLAMESPSINAIESEMIQTAYLAEMEAEYGSQEEAGELTAWLLHLQAALATLTSTEYAWEHAADCHRRANRRIHGD